MTWLFDLQYTHPEICAIQIVGAFVCEGTSWPAGSWYLIHYGQHGRRKVVSDAQFLELERSYGAEAITRGHPSGVGGSPVGPNAVENRRRTLSRRAREAEANASRAQ